MQRQTDGVVDAGEKKLADIVSVDKVLALRLVWINIPRKRVIVRLFSMSNTIQRKIHFWSEIVECSR